MATESKASDLSEQAMALAEQLGRIAGTVEGTAEAWMKKRKKARKKKTGGKTARVARTSDPAHAPGKKRRRPAQSLVGVKKSDERIPKMRTAAAARRRRKSYA